MNTGITSLPTVDDAAGLGDAEGIEARFDSELSAARDRAREAARALAEELAARNIRFGPDLLPSCLKPHFISESLCTGWVRDAERLMGVIERIGEHLLQEATAAREELLPRDAWDLMEIDPGYPRLAVVCRPDMVWSADGALSLLEVNSDSPAMMVYADHLQQILREAFPLTVVSDAATLVFDQRVPALLDALLETYRAWGGAKEAPTIAILDWPKQKTCHEQEQLAQDLTRLGCPALVCCPDQLELRGGRLLARGEAIDIVQRRLLFPEILAHPDRLQPFLTAYRERLACVVNPLRSYAVGNKTLLAELSRGAFDAWLTADQKELVGRMLPTTVKVERARPGQLDKPEQWVLKPHRGSGGQGVTIGRYEPPSRWAAALDEARRGGWIGQRYMPIPRYSVPLLSGDELVSRSLYANWNPFFFGGRYGGAIVRVSPEPVVSISAGGALLPSIVVRDPA